MGASGARRSVNLTQTRRSKIRSQDSQGKQTKITTNLAAISAVIPCPEHILGPDTTYTYRIKTSEAGVVGVAPTGSPTFCLNFCLHWVQLSPRNCMDLHTRGCRHGIYQMCRIMIRSVHFNRGNARNAVARRLHVLPPPMLIFYSAVHDPVKKAALA